jgi:preprotein translocase subunit SecF
MKVEEKTFRFFEVSFYILAISVLFLVAIVLYFVGEKPKMCVDVVSENKYDLNNDGIVDILDLNIQANKTIEIRDYILNENQDTREE